MDIKLPNLGEGADSGTVVNLLVKAGDTVTPGQGLLELENEKAVATIPAPAGGTVGQIFVKVGDRVGVGHRLLSLDDAGGGKAEPVETPTAPSKPTSRPGQERPSPAETGHEPQTGSRPTEPPGAEPATSPSIRRLAQELGLDLSRIRPAKAGGRIRIEDVRSYLDRLQAHPGESQPRAASAPAAPAPAPIDFTRWGPISRKSMSTLGKVVARRMVENWNAIPHVTQFDAADITATLALLKKHLPAYEAQGTRLTFTALALKAVADTLKRHPLFNSSLDEAAGDVVLKEYVHLGLAVDTEAGLVVPVIRDADKKTVLELSRDIDALAKKARERKLMPDEMQGGSFTVSNQGAIGGAHFTPIVNKPEVAILGLGRAAPKAVVREEQIVARMMLPLAVSYDHRVINGAAAARFTVELVAALENFPEKAVAV